MDEKKIYIVYRIYSKAEKQEHGMSSIIYGWSLSKSIIKAFLSQRDDKKYKVIKIYGDLDEIQIDDCYLDNSNMIDFIKLKSSKSGEEVYLFMTANEMQEAEIKIQRYFRDLCTVSDIRGKADYVQMFMAIDNYYASALDFIGYRPPEISAMFPSADYRDDPGEIMGIEELIEEIYI